VAGEAVHRTRAQARRGPAARGARLRPGA
jgi:hypothetical protein